MLQRVVPSVRPDDYVANTAGCDLSDGTDGTDPRCVFSPRAVTRGTGPQSDLQCVFSPRRQDLWGSTDSVASDSLASERSLSMESLAQVP